MPINTNDIKLLESERLTDTDDGGGRATGRVIQSGEINALFPPIDRIDQAFGEFSARKVFGGPQTLDTATYYGAHSAIIQDAADPNISVLMVDTKSDSDTLRDLKNFVQSYQVKGTKTLAQLWGDHLQHQQSLLLFQPVSEAVPSPNDVLFLTEGNKEQAVRIRNVTAEVRQVSVSSSNGDVLVIELRRIMLDLFNGLETPFSGGQPNRIFSHTGALIYTSRPSSGVKYFGVKPLAAAVAAGAYQVKVNDPYLPLAPASRRTEALAAQYPYDNLLTRVTMSQTVEAQNLTLYRDGNTQEYYAYLPWLVGQGATLNISGSILKDRSDGVFEPVGGGEWESARQDTATKRLIAVRRQGLGTNPTYGATLSGKAACMVANQILNEGLVIDTANQRTSYVFDLSELPPELASIKVQYRVLGKSYLANVNGRGEVYGDATGRIDATSNVLQLTLPALPDLGSTVLVTWASNDAVSITTVENRALQNSAKYEYTLSHPIKVGSLTVKWRNQGQELTATDGGTPGSLSHQGQIIGKVAYSNTNGVGEVVFTPGSFLARAVYPDPNTQVTIEYLQSTAKSQAVQMAGGETQLAITLDHAPEPGSVHFTVITEQSHDMVTGERPFLGVSATTRSRSLGWFDDGQGSIVSDSGLSGSVNYLTKSVNSVIAGTYNQTKARIESNHWGAKVVVSQTPATEYVPPQTVLVQYQVQQAAGLAQSESFAVGVLNLRLTQSLTQPILPGSVRLVSGSETLIDVKGALVKGYHPQTGAGQQVGTIDYASHTATFADWTGEHYSVRTLAVSNRLSALNRLVFNTMASPLARNGLNLSATTLSGKRLTGSADNDGNLIGDFVGKVNFDSGLVIATAPDTQNVGQLLPLVPASFQYSGVVEQMVPLDKEVIKIDPIRLPPDGRVPIYREGDLLLLAHTGKVAVATPTAGQVVQTGREYLAALDVVDSKGVALRETEYTADLLAGRVTFATPLSVVDAGGNALTPPLTVRHRIEHMTPVASVQVNGTLGLLTPPYHDYPAGESVACSCPIHGDRWARVHTFFTQANWNSSNPVWSDERVGADTTAKYNALNFPLEMTNQGGINERWAIVFTSASSFNVVGETLGIIATGTTAADTAPINPNTGKPYFVIRAGGWGSGWATNNVVRFNTGASISPVWLIRVTQPGKLQRDQDEFVYQIRGDVV
ncbi:hypothetical protein MM188_003223 [Vibrio cholerae]|nr:hypothetical protein [Vibrio cholerae]